MRLEGGELIRDRSSWLSWLRRAARQHRAALCSQLLPQLVLAFHEQLVLPLQRRPLPGPLLVRSLQRSCIQARWTSTALRWTSWR